MARTISIQRAYQIMNEIAREFNVQTSAPPPLFVTEHIPRKYAGVFESDSTTRIKVRPEYFTERTVAHEAGHWIFHQRCPGVCKGFDPRCEEIARDIEEWWMAGRPRASKHAQSANPRRMVAFTLTRPITLKEAKEAARRIADSEIGDSVDRVGFRDKKFYVVLKSERGVDGFIPLLTPIIAGILGLLGIGVVGWATGLWARGPLGLPNIAWILIAGTALVVAVGWAVGRILK